MIPNSKHRIFPYTFLADTIVAFKFKAPIPEAKDAWNERFSKYVNDNFGVDYSEEDAAEGNYLSVSLKTPDVSYAFNDDELIFQAGFEGYTDFVTSAVPYLSRAFNFYSAVAQDFCHEATLTKLNLIPFDVEGKTNTEVADKIFSQLLSAELLGQQYQVVKDDSWNGAPLRVIDVEEDIKVKYGIVLDPGQVPYLIIELSCTKTSTDGVTKDDLTEMDNRLFDVFCWSVSGNVMRVMEKGGDHE